MAFTWYSVGLLEDFDSITGATQVVNPAYAQNSPYYSIYLIQNQSILKFLPESSAEMWVAFSNVCVIVASSTITGRIMSLRKADGTTELAYLFYDKTTNNIQVWVNGIQVGTFPTSVGTIFAVEIHLKMDATNGVLEVWKDGTQVVSYTGNTGASTNTIGSIYQYSGTGTTYVSTYISNIIVTNAGRIGNKKPVIVPLSGAGSANPPAYYSFIGNNPASCTSANMSSNITIILPKTFDYEGTIQAIGLSIATAGTLYVGICTRGSNGFKNTTRLVSSQITVPTGLVTLQAGVDFPNNWIVSTDETVAIFFETARTYRNNISVVDTDNLNIANYYYYLGNALAITSELTYDNASIPQFLGISCQYKVTDTSLAFSTSVGISNLFRRPYANANSYAQFASVDDEMACQIGDLPITCSAVKSVRVCSRVTGGNSLTTADYELNIGGSNLATNKELPTVLANQSAQFDGSWTPAQFNSAQIGIKVKA